MKNYVLAVLAALGVALGTVAAAAPAHAYVYLHQANTNEGSNN